MAIEINKETATRVLKSFGAVLGKRMDFVLLGLMGASTLGVALIYLTEASTGVPPVIDPKPKELTPMITAKAGDAKSAAYFAVFDLIKPIKPLDQTDYQALIDFNMFDAKAARDAEQLHDEAKQKLKEAEARFEEGNYSEAKRLAEEAIERSPTMQAAVRLLDQIKAKTAPAEGAAGAEAGSGSAPAGPAEPTPTGTPPAVPTP